MRLAAVEHKTFLRASGPSASKFGEFLGDLFQANSAGQSLQIIAEQLIQRRIVGLSVLLPWPKGRRQSQE
jgi:hypothetical protein